MILKRKKHTTFPVLISYFILYEVLFQVFAILTKVFSETLWIKLSLTIPLFIFFLMAAYYLAEMLEKLYVKMKIREKTRMVRVFFASACVLTFIIVVQVLSLTYRLDVYHDGNDYKVRYSNPIEN